jgi:hypothetical protein
MPLLDPNVARVLTLIGAGSEVIGLPLAIIDYRWPKKARDMERSIHRLVGIPYSKVWDRFAAIFGGGPIGELNSANMALGSLAIAAGVRAGFLIRHAGVGWFGVIAGGITAWIGAVFFLVFGLPLLVMLLARILVPRDWASHGRPLGLFGVLLACVGLLVSLLHVLEIVAETLHFG